MKSKPLMRSSYLWRAQIKVFPVGIYEYQFVPLKTQEPIFVRRLDSAGCPKYTRHESPYTDLPRIKSHAHPFFVVYFSHKQILNAFTIGISPDIDFPVMRLNRMCCFPVPPEFCTRPLSPDEREALTPTFELRPRHSSSYHAGGSSQVRLGAKSPRDADDDSSLVISNGLSLGYDSGCIQTHNDSTSCHSETCECPKLNLSLNDSDVLYNSDSLLRWIRSTKSWTRE